MEKMYIARERGVITIGDTFTGNENEGHRFMFCSMKEAEKTYREIYNVKHKRFKKVFTNKIQFGYIY